MQGPEDALSSALSRFIKRCWNVCTQIASVQVGATELIRPAGVPPCGGVGRWDTGVADQLYLHFLMSPASWTARCVLTHLSLEQDLWASWGVGREERAETPDSHWSCRLWSCSWWPLKSRCVHPSSMRWSLLASIPLLEFPALVQWIPSPGF